MKRTITALLALLTMGGGLPYHLAAQGSVDPDRGVVAVARALRGLGAVKRVLVIGAHPDDEDTELLTWLERGVGAEAAYLSLTRGEGGQNLIGPELGVGLGLIRTEELLAARRLDGARQFFTRAYDFGYSKSADETFRFWDRDSLLADVVAVVRRFRPQVIVSIFSGTRRDGHGQHRVAGILAREAFDAAGDPERFPEQLEAGHAVWRPLKLYRSTRFDTAATTLTIRTGEYDPLYGRSYHQIAMASRSQHRSQDMGRIEGLGPNITRLQRLESRVAAAGPGSESSIFDGVDTTLAGLLEGIDSNGADREVASLLGSYREQLVRARAALEPWSAAAAVAPLDSALTALEALTAAIGSKAGAPNAAFILNRKIERLQRALLDAAGVVVGAFADDDLVVPGQALGVQVQVWNGGERPVELEAVELRVPEGWAVRPLDPAATMIGAGELARRRFEVRVPRDAEPTVPYFLRQERDGAMYRWPADPELRALPFAPPPLSVRAVIRAARNGAAIEEPVVYRFADPAFGEIRRPIEVVPAVSVSVSPTLAVWPLGRDTARTFTVRLRGEAPEGAAGVIRAEAPPGWTARPDTVAFELGPPGSAATREFALARPASVGAGSYRVRVAARADGALYTRGYTIIDYPHIQRRLLYGQAEARIETFPVEVASGLRVGYIPGAGDAVLPAIRALGVSAEELDEAAIASRDLSRYDVIVIGIRAYETNRAVRAHNGRLLDWARRGGTLIVQYQQYAYFRGDVAPYPLAAAFPHDRVTDETAPIEVLEPEHRLFRSPNRIGPADFEGWVQERGLYFANWWDPKYRPLIETADPGEPPRRGGLLVAEFGEGLYVYTGLALFRQLPAGVPGAYRLLANLLSLGA